MCANGDLRFFTNSFGVPKELPNMRTSLLTRSTCSSEFRDVGERNTILCDFNYEDVHLITLYVNIRQILMLVNYNFF